MLPNSPSPTHRHRGGLSVLGMLLVLLGQGPFQGRAFAAEGHHPAGASSRPVPLASGPARAAAEALPCFEARPSLQGLPSRAIPEDVGLAPEALQALVRGAQESRSDALLVLAKGQLLVDRDFGSPEARLNLMSVSKAISSLAIGCLLVEGKISSLDAPLATWFPAWKKPSHASITLKHLLTHTTGLEHPRMALQLNAAPDRIAYVLSLPVGHPPGSHFAYSNEAFQLLAGIVKQASGQDLAAYLDQRVFKPLDLRTVAWNRDQVGTPECYGGLMMSGPELAKVGLMLAQGGRWQGRSLVPEAWLKQATQPAEASHPGMGLAWFLHRPWGQLRQNPTKLAALEAAGSEEAKALRELNGLPMAMGQYGDQVRRILGMEGARRFQLFAESHGGAPLDITSSPVGFAAHDGWLGQYLCFDQRSGLVVVRMTRYREEGDRQASDTFQGLYEHTKRLRRALPM